MLTCTGLRWCSGLAAILAAFAGLALNGLALAQTPTDDPFGESATLEYSTEITGLAEEPALLEALERASRLIRLQDSPPATTTGLARRAESDLDTFAAILRSEGFYSFEVSYEIDTAASPAVVTVPVATGPVYLLAEYSIVYEPPAEALPTDIAALGLEIGMRAEAQPVAEAQDALLQDLARRGFPLAEIIERRVVIDRSETSMMVELRVDPGPAAAFGDVTIEGLERVDANFVQRRIPWTRGASFDQSEVEALRQALVSSGLFATVRISSAEAVSADGTLPVAIELREAPTRSIGVGANFSTSEGLAIVGFWENRSLFGEGERLRLSATLGELEQSADASYRIPGLIRLDQDFVSSIEIGREDTDAFESIGIKTSAGLEQRFGDTWRAFAGVSLDVSEIEDEDGKSEIALVGLPVSLTRDTTNDPLDATEGARFTLSATPFAGEHEGSVSFLVNEVTAAAFLSIDADDRFVLAARGRLGSIIGEETARIPADKRFFAGGGGSVRGFEFQRVGPLDATGDPVGGRSVYEVGVELRTRLSDTIGLVPFLEGGQVFDDSVPDFSEEPLWAAGLGLRYFTAVGPIRFDIATPLNGRSTDDDFQFYVSFGQAF